MARKIVVTEEAYQAIKRAKRSGESYSEMFLRLLPMKKYISAKDLVGVLGDDPEGAIRMRKELAEYRKQLNIDAEKRWQRIWSRK